MEDYKKKYEEALERAKEIHAEKRAQPFDVMTKIFPELKESKDERIWTINYLNNRKLNSSIIEEKESLKKAIAWLEKQGEQNIKMIQWKGDNLREVVEFTGKSPKFNEWFKTWDDFENYVHSHGNIFKLFCEDGSHYEVPVGAWIVKTPDGYNVASKATYVKRLSEKHGCFIIDKKLLNEVIECLKYTNYWVCGGNDEIINKLKHLKPQPADKQGEQKPAWSKEDERLQQCLIEDQEKRLEEVRNDKVGHSEIISDLKEMYRERINWLKSLKERYAWKPSYEQMEALEDSIEFLGCTKKVREYLKSLYQDLKRLREE